MVEVANNVPLTVSFVEWQELTNVMMEVVQVVILNSLEQTIVLNVFLHVLHVQQPILQFA